MRPAAADPAAGPLDGQRWSQVATLDQPAPDSTDSTHSTIIPASWSQGRAAFGGLVTGLGLRAIQNQVDEQSNAKRPLRSLQVTFVAPLATGPESPPVQIQVQGLRSGRALSQTQAQISQDGQLCALLVAAHGQARTTALPPVPAVAPPAGLDPSTLPTLPFVPGLTPAFAQHLDYRWGSVATPFSGSEQADIAGAVRLRDDQPVDLCGAVALADAWPAPVLCRLDRPAAASTVSWMINIVSLLPPGGVDPTGWWRFASQTHAASQGYATVDGQLWRPDGQLTILSRQLVAEFSKPTVSTRT